VHGLRAQVLISLDHIEQTIVATLLIDVVGLQLRLGP
jgi:hypothetical protein